MIVQKFYNPHDLQSSVVLRVATGRERIRARIRRAIESNRDSQQIQHILVSAPRGFGKSFLLRLVQIEVESRYSDVAFVLLPEEQPNIDEPDALIREIRRIWLKERLDTVQPRWYEPENDAWDEAAASLDRAIDQHFGKGKGILVVAIENFDVMVERVFKNKIAESQLREWLTRRNNRIMLLATTSTGIIDGSYDARLFQAFESIKIAPWDEDECLEFFNKGRMINEKSELDERGRIKARAVSTFIGGTPRLAALLGEALLDNDSLRSAEILDKVADELTPYYKQRVEALNPRSRKLLDALLRGGEPCSQTKLAERVGASSQAAIAQPFKALLDEQILVARKTKNSREILYSVQDRVFAHYYRTRYLTHGQQPNSLEAIVDFLETYFSKDEKRSEAARLLNLGRPLEARLLADMATREEIGPLPRTDNLRRAAKRLRLNAILLRVIGEPSVIESLDALESSKFEVAAYKAHEISRSSTDPSISSLSLAISGWAKYGLRLDDDARNNFDQSITKAKELGSADEIVVALRERGIYRAVALGDRTGSIDDSLAACELKSHVSSDGLRVVALLSGSRGYSQINQRHDALGSAHEAASIAARIGDPLQHARCKRELAFLLTHYKRYDEALVKAQEAAQLAALAQDKGEQAECLRLAAENLQRLAQHEKAIALARQANALAAMVGDLNEQAKSLGTAAQSLGRYGRYREAIEVAKEAAGLARFAGEGNEQARYLRLAAWDYGYARDYAAQVNTANDAAKISEQYEDKFGQAKALRISALGLMRLKRIPEAIAAAERAAAFGGLAGSGGGQSENLQLAAWILGSHGQHEDAITKAREAADIAATEDNPALEAQCWINVAINLRKLLRYDDAIVAAEKAAELSAHAGDIGGQVECLLAVIWNLKRLSRFGDIQTVARQAAALAKSISHPSLEAQALRELVRAASILGEVVSTITAFERWRAIENGFKIKKAPLSNNYLQYLLVAGVKSMRTSPVIEFFAREQQSATIALKDWQAAESGHAIVDILKEKGRAEAFGVVADFINSVAPHVRVEGYLSGTHRSRALFSQLTITILNTIAISIKDAAFLQNLVDLVQEALGSKFAPLTQVLKAAAQFHESNGSADSLDRIDPDIAAAILRAYSNSKSDNTNLSHISPPEIAHGANDPL